MISIFFSKSFTNSETIPAHPKTLLQIMKTILKFVFFILSDKLRNEFRNYKIIRTDEEWEASRIAFLQSHVYFTTSSQKRRNPAKHLHLKQLINTELKK